MDRYTANRYIWLKDQIAAGGSVPQELLDEVAALDATVNGDETSEPPVVGLVDVVGDLEETVEDLDIDINGDDTTEPPTPGLKDRVSDLETTINGDSSATPAIPPLLAGAGNMRISLLWTNDAPSASYNAGTEDLGSSDYDIIMLELTTGVAFAVKGGGVSYSVYAGTFSSVNYMCRRGFSCSGSTLTVTDCVDFKISDGTDGVRNAAMVPLKVYGIKFMLN